MRYNITDPKDYCIRQDIYEWLSNNISKDDYKIIDDGFWIGCYYLIFNSEKAEILFKLKWDL